MKPRRGFIALISAIVISTILLGLAITAGSSTFSTRFDALNGEYKRVSLGLAESCIHAALLNIGQNFSYVVAPGTPGYSASRHGVVIPIGTAYGTTTDCVILSPHDNAG